MKRIITTVIVTLAALVIPVTAQASCTGTCHAYWYENNVKLEPEYPSPILGWGHLTINVGGEVGPLECDVAGAGRIFNPTSSNGRGRLQLAAFYCEPVIPTAACQIVEKMTVDGTGLELLNTENVRFGLKAEYTCTYGGLPAAKGEIDSYEPATELRPGLEPGSSMGIAPAKLLFGHTGEWIAGNLKVFGFYASGMIRAVNSK